MTIEEQINSKFLQESEITFKNIDGCHFSVDLTYNICHILEKIGIEDEDLACNIDSLIRLDSSFFAIGTLYYIDQLRKR